MANIGNFTREGESFNGSINTLTLKVKATFKALSKTNPKAPDYRVYANGIEIGAAWSHKGKEDRPFLSVKLDDPSFPAAIYCRLVEHKEGGHRLLWDR